MRTILEFFKNNPLDPNEPTIKRYPKYIKDPKLFEYQLNEPYFRKSLLIQLKNVFVTIDNPIKQNPNFGSFKDQIKEKIKSFQDLIAFLLKRYKGVNSKNSLHTIAAKVLKTEVEWINWKVAGCPALEKFLSEKEVRKLEQGERLAKRNDESLAKKLNDIKNWLKLGNDYTHLEALNKSTFFIDRRPVQPAMSLYFVSMPENMNEKELEDLAKNEVVTWRAKRAMFRDFFSLACKVNEGEWEFDKLIAKVQNEVNPPAKETKESLEEKKNEKKENEKESKNFVDDELKGIKDKIKSSSSNPKNEGKMVSKRSPEKPEQKKPSKSKKSKKE